MNQRPTIREQMDACRPDSDDLHLPEHAADLAELKAALRESGEVQLEWERSEQESRLFRGAVQDVSLPAGLEARLLAAVQAAQQKAPASDDPVVTLRAKTSRRWFLQVATGLTVAAAVVLLGLFFGKPWTPTDESITKDQLAGYVEGWLGSVDVRNMVKPARTNQSPPGGFVLGTITGSKAISSPQGKLTAYSISLPGNRTATLLVIPTAQQYPVNAVPYSTITGISGGWNVGAWQRDGLLYIIAVPDNSGTHLDQFVPKQPIG